MKKGKRKVNAMIGTHLGEWRQTRGITAAALALQLDFVPLSAERYDLVIPDAYFDAAPVQALLHEVTRASLRRELELLAGYDTRQTGNRVL